MRSILMIFLLGLVLGMHPKEIQAAPYQGLASVRKNDLREMTVTSM